MRVSKKFNLLLLITWFLMVNVLTVADENKEAILARLQQHYLNRIQEFKEENQKLKNIILLGDSLTEGFKVEQYFPGLHVLNRGIVADHIGLGKTGILHRLDCSVYDCNPSKVFLMIAVNDIADKTWTMDELEQGYRKIISEIQKNVPGLEIYIQSCLPTGKKHTYLNPLIVEFNQRLQALAKELNLTYIDLHSLMKDEQGEIREELTTEGLHLTPTAYAIWREALEKYIAPAETNNP